MSDVCKHCGIWISLEDGEWYDVNGKTASLNPAEHIHEPAKPQFQSTPQIETSACEVSSIETSHALPPLDVNAADRAVASRTKRRKEWQVAEDLACRERQLLALTAQLAAEWEKTANWAGVAGPHAGEVELLRAENKALRDSAFALLEAIPGTVLSYGTDTIRKAVKRLRAALATKIAMPSDPPRCLLDDVVNSAKTITPSTPEQAAEALQARTGVTRALARLNSRRAEVGLGPVTLCSTEEAKR